MENELCHARPKYLEVSLFKESVLHNTLFRSRAHLHLGLSRCNIVCKVAFYLKASHLHLGQHENWYVTSLCYFKQIVIKTFELRGQKGQNRGQKFKNQLQPVFLKFDVWDLLVAGDSKPLKTLSFDLGGHWR